MSEMSKVEEVARALKAKIAGYDWVYFRDLGATCLIDGDIDMNDVAKAAIEAMREPTEAMRDRYNDPDVVGYGPDGSNHDLVWNAGIDAALKE